MELYIGSAIRKIRETQGHKQHIFTEMANMSQSNLSNIENNHQQASWKQIELFAKLLDISTHRLTGNDTPAVYIETQSGDHNNNGHNHVVHSDGEVRALQNVIDILKERLLKMEEKESERVAELKARINTLEDDNRYWRGKAGH